MSCSKANCPRVEPMVANSSSAENAAPYTVQAHHLLCAVCVRGGCGSPPCGREKIDKLLEVLWDFPHILLHVTADMDVSRAYYADIYEGENPSRIPENFPARSALHSDRRKDLEVCRLLGIYPNTDLPAFHAYSILFNRQNSLCGMCHSLSGNTQTWPECPHAKSGYYEKIAQTPHYSLREQYQNGEDMASSGLWAMIRPRTRNEMAEAKRQSSEFILNTAKQLFIRPHHLLCMLCTRNLDEPLEEDNLVELRMRIENEPNIPVTLTEGCCMVCDPCNVYHTGEHLCYSGHPKDILRDLRMLEILGLEPGATLPARELYRLIFERIESTKVICGWGDSSDYSPFWGPCQSANSNAVAEARKEGFLLD